MRPNHRLDFFLHFCTVTKTFEITQVKRLLEYLPDEYLDDFILL